MDKKLAVVVIHGMGKQEKKFAEPAIKMLGSRLNKAGFNPDQIAWKSIFGQTCSKKPKHAISTRLSLRTATHPGNFGGPGADLSENLLSKA